MFNCEYVKYIKRNIIVYLIFVLTSISFSQVMTNADTNKIIAKRSAKISDGFYLILKEGKTKNEVSSIKSDEIILSYINEIDTTQKTPRYLLVKRAPNVALDLEKQPTLNNNGDSKKTILYLTLAARSAKELKEFSEKNIMRQVAFVIDGTVITVHKIRAAINNGEVQITRCTDNACQVLYLKLKEKVSKK